MADASFKSLILDVYQKRQAEFVPKSPNEVWVSWLSECQVKRQHDNLSAGNSWWLIRGIVTHIGVQSFLQGEVAEVEKKVEYPLEVDGTQYVLKGSVDVVMKDGTLVELKTSRRTIPVFYPQHVFQLQVYMFILNADHGRLVYLTPDDVVEYVVTPEGVGNSLLPSPRITHEYLVSITREYLQGKRIAPFHECSSCFLRTTCPQRR